MKKLIYKAIILFMFICIPLNAQAATPKITNARPELLYGKSFIIKSNQKVIWKSSNKKVLTVSSSGKVKAVGYGTAKITAINKKGEKKSCKITVKQYTIKITRNKKYPRQVTIYTGDGNYKTYKVCNQKGFNSSYLKQRGCSHSSASMVLSAYGKNFTPLEIHNGSVNKKYSEQYALKKLGKRVAVTGQSLSIYSISEILNNAGVKCHPVYKFKDSKAIKEITNNLKEGRPVLIMCHRKTVNGNKLAKSYHFLVLIGIDQDGYAIVLNASGGTINTSHCTGAFKLTVKELVKNHMWSCTGNEYKSFYFNGAKNYGGYIIVDE